MEVHLTAEVEAKLSRIASEQGRNSESLVQEAVERLVDYDSWFLSQVEQGIAAADRGDFLSHEDVGELIDKRYPS